jgi:hypothetical protein
MMQHGSILLRRSPFAAELPGIAELAGRDIEIGELQRTIVSALATETGWQFVSDAWTGLEWQTATELERHKYATPEWNENR